MSFLPIVERELRVASRRRATYWVRVVAVLLGLLVGAWVFLVAWGQQPSVVGQGLFVGLAGLMFLYALMAGIRATSDVLSVEKREGTLGLLFLTDLKGYDVVLGKLAAGSLSHVYALMAMVPLLAIPLLMGGVTVAEFGRISLVCVNTLFFSLAAGLLASSMSRQERAGMGMTLGLVLGVTVGIPLLALLGEGKGWISNEWRNWLFCVSPAWGLQHGFGFVFRPNYYWASVGWVHGMGWLFIGAASLIVPRTWQDRPVRAVSRMSWRDWIRGVSYGKPERRLRIRRRYLPVNPFLWLSVRNRFKFPLVWFLLVLGGGLWFWGYWEHREYWLTVEVYVFTALVTHTLLKLWLASEACQQLHEARQTGALELVLCTPATEGQIVRGHAGGLWRQFGVPILVVAAVDGVLMVASMKEQSNFEGYWMILFLTGIGILLLDAVALGALGMWEGLKRARVNHGIVNTVAVVMLLPWLLFGGIATGVAMLDAFRVFDFYQWMRRKGIDDAWIERAPLLLWLVLSVGVGVAATLWGLWGLKVRLRELAAARHAPPKSRWWRRRL